MPFAFQVVRRGGLSLNWRLMLGNGKGRVARVDAMLGW